MSPRATLLPLLLCLGLAGPAAAAPAVQTLPLALGEQATVYDLYLPRDPPRAMALVAHGFTRSRAQHVQLATRLAEAGFLVAVPDLPHWTRHEANADALVALAAEVSALPCARALPVVLIGTSAGGLSTLLAAERIAHVVLWVGLDPVDAFRQGRRAAQALQVPALVLRAPAGACNVGGSARRVASWLPEGHRLQRIDDASHCDFEDHTDTRCEQICGPADATRQALILQITVDAALQAVPAAAPADAVACVSAPRP
jgi:pimeloyl-ACP methyl ester carboxylesterase